MKACEGCARVTIGPRYIEISAVRVFFGMFFIYLPILFLPFVFCGAFLTYLHLKIIGATDLRSFRSFMPDWSSHRYKYKSQILMRDVPKSAFWCRTRIFWIFNCTLYCPFSVALLEWTTYMTKVVENWWCPFHHSKKENYADAAIDMSFWHTNKDAEQLHLDDRFDPTFNEAALAEEIVEVHPQQRKAS